MKVRYKTNFVDSFEEQQLHSSAIVPDQTSNLSWLAESAQLSMDHGSWLGRHVGRRNRHRETEDDDGDKVMDGENGFQKTEETVKIDNSMKMNVLANWERDIIWE